MTERVFWGTTILAVSVLLIVLLIMWALLPNPHRGFTPPPLDRDGFTYTCFCWQDTVRVTILAEPPSRRKHARVSAPLSHRLTSTPNARTGGARERGAVPIPAAV
ncbi:hypothetical protein ACIQ6V_18030 [Streptomyces sp. NPDC096198]|uniref:hypothetical protein n=1 Tax=Streptomyces sp. NPDC096198 TaxID=3366080 RepID=UPI003823DC44